MKTKKIPVIAAITEDNIDINQIVEQITSDSTGAVAIFSGIVRGKTARTQKAESVHKQIQETTYLEYEAYVPMAKEKMKQVAEEIQERWASIEGIAIIQRIGKLYPRTPTVLIACTAAHRNTGVFDAAHYGIDRLKEIVPVWKKEVTPDGESWVKGKYLPTKDD